MSFTDRLQPKSLGGTLILWFIVASSGLVVLTAAMCWVALFRGMDWRDDQALDTRVASIREVLLAPQLDRQALEREVGEDQEGPRQLFVRVFGPPAIGTYDTVRFPTDMTLDRFVKAGGAPSGTLRQVTISLGGERFLGAFQSIAIPERLGGGQAVIIMALDTGADDAVVDRYTLLILLIAAGGVILSILAGRLLIRRQLQPLRQLAEQTAAIGKSTLGHRLTIANLPTEMTAFVDQFNSMIGRLELAYNGLRRYSDDVAHELRTPLNRIQLGAEVALANEHRTPEDYRKALETTFLECQHLNSVVRGLLFIASAENGSTSIGNESFLLFTCLERIRAAFEDSALDGGVTIRLDCDAGLTMRGDATLVQRAVVNLVSNALSHTPRGGTVSIAAWTEGDDVRIDVKDTGEGVSPEDLPHVFDRFYRRDGAKGRDGTRLGLGLAITKSIVELHQGQVTVESAPGAGAKFSLVFPQMRLQAAG
jgi:two-component system heavy metal sensor histidine kinase CusS